MSTFDDSAIVSSVDSRGHPFVEMPFGNGSERCRFTYIAHPSWIGHPAVRIQKRGVAGNLFEGVEIPVSQTWSAMVALSRLMVIVQENPSVAATLRVTMAETPGVDHVQD